MKKQKQLFQVIASDPPWPFSDKLKMSDVKRGAESNYHTMSIQDIKDLRVKEIADPEGCVLALWVPSSLLQEGLDTMKSWGFKQKQTYIWVKTKKLPLRALFKSILKNVKNATSLRALLQSIKFDINDILAFGMGRLFRQTHEICLVGVNNNKIYKKLKNKSQRSVSLDINLKHSAKPDLLQNALEIMFPNTSKLEMFARRNKIGWVCVGDEVCNGEDIRKSIENLLGA